MSLKLYNPFEILINLINAEYPKIDADIYFSDTLDAQCKLHNNNWRGGSGNKGKETDYRYA